MFARIRWRLVGWSVVVLALILALVGLAVYATLSRSLLDEVDRNLAARAEEVAAGLRELDDDHLRLGREQGYRGGLFYLVLDPAGRLLADPQGIGLAAAGLAPLGDGSSRYASATLAGEPVRLYARPLSERGRVIAQLVVGQSLAPVEAILRRLVLILLAGGGVGLVLSLLGGWFLAGRALVPIQQAFSRQQQFVADASHELRTPLTVLRSATELLNRHREEPLAANGELFDDLCQEIGRLERLAGDLLTLARSDLGELALAVGEVDLAALAAQVSQRTAALAAQRGPTLSYAGNGEPLPVEGDPDRLQQVLLILLDNALKHTPAGGQVVVSTRRQGSEAVVQVQDSGDGIPAEQLPKVFERFYRVDRARSRADGGAGLGLAIAKSLVEAHRGQLGLTSSTGAGTTATIHLPLAGQQPALRRLRQTTVGGNKP